MGCSCAVCSAGGLTQSITSHRPVQGQDLPYIQKKAILGPLTHKHYRKGSRNQPHPLYRLEETLEFGFIFFSTFYQRCTKILLGNMGRTNSTKLHRTFFDGKNRRAEKPLVRGFGHQQHQYASDVDAMPGTIRRGIRDKLRYKGASPSRRYRHQCDLTKRDWSGRVSKYSNMGGCPIIFETVTLTTEKACSSRPIVSPICEATVAPRFRRGLVADEALLGRDFFLDMHTPNSTLHPKAVQAKDATVISKPKVCR